MLLDIILYIALTACCLLLVQVYLKLSTRKKCRIVEKDFKFLEEKYGFKVSYRDVSYVIYSVIWRKSDNDDISIYAGYDSIGHLPTAFVHVSKYFPITDNQNDNTSINIDSSNQQEHEEVKIQYNYCYLLEYKEDPSLINVKPIERLHIAAKWLENHMDDIKDEL